MDEEKKLPATNHKLMLTHTLSPTVERLRETFAPAAAGLRPEDEPAVVYKPDSEQR